MKNKRLGFTLTELMITVAIVAIVSVIGAITVNSRLRVSRLEEAALTIASDVSYARTAALFKGCPTRFILCGDRLCENKTPTVSDEMIVDSGESARYYAILRKSQSGSALEDCYSDTDPDSGTVSAFAEFDYDRKPQQIGRGVAFSAIYDASGLLDQTDWSDESSSAAGNSLWFPVSLDDDSANQGILNLPVSNELDADGNWILFQVQLDDCDASSADEDCLGYFVTMDSSGETGIQACTPGTRNNNTDICF